MLTRPGTTLAELLVAITLAAAVLGTATASALHQQRSATRLGGRAAAEAQLRPAAASVVSQLSYVNPAAGDLVAGEWRDTAVQFRAAIATGITCQGAVGALALPVEPAGTMPLGGVLSPPREGDSAWVYSDSTGSWTGRPVVAVGTARDACIATAPSTLRIDLASSDTVPAGAAVRITRQIRLVVYRGGDGAWQLGMRDWSESAHELTAPQPLAGPFVAGVGGEVRTGFRYFDADGAELQVERDPEGANRVRRLRFTMLVVRHDAATSPDVVARDSIDVAFPSAHAP